MDRAKKKKIAAAVGVMNFLKTEQPHILAATQTFIPTVPEPWAAYSRQQIMANNQFMQRRVLKR